MLFAFAEETSAYYRPGGTLRSPDSHLRLLHRGKEHKVQNMRGIPHATGPAAFAEALVLKDLSVYLNLR